MGTNIFFLDYSDDPWMEASVKTSLSESMQWCLTTCDGCGHCGAGVPSDLTQCTDEAQRFVDEWMGAAAASSSSPSPFDF